MHQVNSKVTELLTSVTQTKVMIVMFLYSWSKLACFHLCTLIFQAQVFIMQFSFNTLRAHACSDTMPAGIDIQD